jgi:polysaccharide biosynthesis/export protein
MAKAKSLSAIIPFNAVMRHIPNITFFLSLVIVTTFSLSSCTTTRELSYFQDLPDSSVVTLPVLLPEDRLIQKNDRLHITFGARDEQAAAIFNKYGGVLTSGNDLVGSVSQSSMELTGYLVDQNGQLEFPVIGKIRAEGMTSQRLKDTLTRLTRVYLKDPLVNVRFLSFRVTILGEVKSPGTYNLPLQRTTILDALGASGDLSRAADRFDIFLYRDYGGTRLIRKIDLKSKAVLYDPDLFLLNNNDVIYVRPRKSGLKSENAGMITSVLAMAISAITLIIALKK